MIHRPFDRRRLLKALLALVGFLSGRWAPTRAEPLTKIREVVIDIETTGFSPTEGHRIIEIACLELLDRKPTKRTFHTYVNPRIRMPENALELHGLSSEFLSQFPAFAEIGPDFLRFIGDDPLVMHHADFDLAFLNAELKEVETPEILPHHVTDTMLLARGKFPGRSRIPLDALCQRFDIRVDGVDTTASAQKIAMVYQELSRL